MPLASPEQEELIRKRFTEQRARLGAQKRSLTQQFEEQNARQAAILGGQSGATLKNRAKGIAEIARGIGEAEAGLGASEAQVLQQAESEAEARKFAREERLGAQEFQAQQSEKQLQFAKDSFAETMKFQWSEFDENLKTNFVNAFIALKDAGFLDRTKDELQNLFSSGMAPLFGTRVPNPPPATASTSSPPPPRISSVSPGSIGFRRY